MVAKYEHRCEGGASALFGEVRVAMPSACTLGVFPSGVRWPAVDIGDVGTPTPVTLVGGDSLTHAPAAATTASTVAPAPTASREGAERTCWPAEVATTDWPETRGATGSTAGRGATWRVCSRVIG